VPVAAAEVFVGRRHELQRALRVLRDGERAGVLLHGQGRLGKSSLAARIADRMPEHAMAVVFGDYGALGILDAVLVAVRANREARELIESRLTDVRQRPEAIESALIDLLNGPLAQAGDDTQKPLLLIIDDLEQILVANPAGPHRVAPENAPVLSAVLRAFDPGETDSRLLVTSRYTFTLGGLESRLADVQLPPLTEVSQRKLQRRQQANTPLPRQIERAELADRAVTVSRGNPGLQDLIGLRLVYGEQVSDDRAEAAVAGMEAYLQQGDLPTEPQVRAFLENLALDALVDEAGPSNVALLRAATLFDLPVPEPVVEALAREVGGSVTRLRGLGLLDPYVDLFDPARSALAVNPLAAGRVEPLSDDDRAALAAASISPLFAAWGAEAGSSRRDRTLDLQLTCLALLADDPAPVAACAGDAVAALRSGPAVDAFRLGQDAIELLDRHSCVVPLFLLRQTADAAFTSGDGEAGERMLDRAVRQADSGDIPGTKPLEQARVIAEHARRLIIRGDLEQAERLLRQAHQMFASGGSEREAAVAMGSIANINYVRGNYDEALRIHQETELPTFERLGDTRGIAATWGQIADIEYNRSNYDEAIRIQYEIQLPAYQRLGETRSIAITWGRIADIYRKRGDYDEALRIHQEVELPTFERLGDTREIAIAWGKIADIEYDQGNYDEALRIRQEIELPIYERLGDTRTAIITWSQIADINQQCGNYNQASELRLKVLEVARKLGDLPGIAATIWGLAQIDLARKDYEAAIPRLVEAFQIFTLLRQPHQTVLAGLSLGQLLKAMGETEEALRILGESLDAARKLGLKDMVEDIGKLIDSLPIAYGKDSVLEAKHEPVRDDSELP
jgi:tetratricopeptide (TPR) repeat protein